MVRDSFRFNIGDIDCLVISDGAFTVPESFRNAVPAENGEAPEEKMEMLCLLVRMHGHSVLIDTGWGAGSQAGCGKLLQNLRSAGVRREEIDTVILSHSHPDHIGGNTDAKNKPVFPNARFFISQKEWEMLTSESALSQLKLVEKEKQVMLSAVRKNLMPLQDRLELIEGDTEILKGIRLIEAPGHSPGHMIVTVSSGSEQLLYTGDLFQHLFQLERPHRGTATDFSPEQSESTRIKVLSRITENSLIFACHFPFPGLGHIVKENDIWRWQPIEMKS